MTINLFKVPLRMTSKKDGVPVFTQPTIHHKIPHGRELTEPVSSFILFCWPDYPSPSQFCSGYNPGI